MRPYYEGRGGRTINGYDAPDCLNELSAADRMEVLGELKEREEKEKLIISFQPMIDPVTLGILSKRED